jgi:hypothetical protein
MCVCVCVCVCAAQYFLHVMIYVKESKILDCMEISIFMYDILFGIVHTCITVTAISFWIS